VTKPLLDPPCKGWQRDLPGPNDLPTDMPDIVFGAPNHLDDVYLEISRRLFSVRGILVALGLLALVCGVISSVSNITSFYNVILKSDGFDEEIAIGAVIIVGTFAIFFWVAGTSIRLDLFPPRSEPIRFNRARRKVYVYGFHFVWWNPLALWYVTTKSYDWDDLRAEAWKQRGATANGILIINEGVSLAVVKPGTNQVIDRFHLSGSVQTALWAYICTYMQKGPDALKPCDAPMRDANDTYNPITRLAPKVQWPEAMDIESRTAP